MSHSLLMKNHVQYSTEFMGTSKLQEHFYVSHETRHQQDCKFGNRYKYFLVYQHNFEEKNNKKSLFFRKVLNECDANYTLNNIKEQINASNITKKNQDRNTITAKKKLFMN